jgi:hypothetical protein
MKVSNIPHYVLSHLFFPTPQCVLPQVSHTLQHVAIVGLGSAKFWLIKRGQRPETIIVFALPFLVYLHYPRACSIILHIGLSAPHTLRRAGKFKCRWRRVRLRARRCVCLPPWPPWIVAIASTCAPAVWAWCFCLGPTWSLLGFYVLGVWPDGLRSLWIWTTLHWGTCLSSRRRLA